MGLKKTEGIKAEIIAAYSNGSKLAEIADKHGVSISAVYKVLQSANATLKESKKTEDKHQQIRQDYLNGASIREVLEKYRVGKITLLKILSEGGLTFRPPAPKAIKEKPIKITKPVPVISPTARLQVKTYCYKLKPTKEQQIQFGNWLGSCRYMYNLCLDYKSTLWRHNKISVSQYEAQSELTAIANETPWMREVCAATRQDVVERLYRAYDGFYKQGKGYPKFAKKGTYRSFTLKQRVGFHADFIRLPVIGKVRYFKNRPCDGKIKRATVSERVDGWYVSIITEAYIEPLPFVETSIGIDVGVKMLTTTSDGEIIDNPKYLYKSEKKLKRLQRSVSRKKKGSNNRKKAAKKLAKCHQKIKNSRTDFQHKVTTRLIRENQTISIESLSIDGMVKNHNLAKSISDASWGRIFTFLDYKAKWYGRELVKVNPAYTTQDCSICGYRNKSLTLKIRNWTCSECGAVHDRDANAAVNILNKAVGHTVSAFEVYAPVTVVAKES